jgi:Na+/H+ antiporter NhaC
LDWDLLERRGRGDGRLGCLSAVVVAMALAAGRKRSMMKLGERRDPKTAPSMALRRAESAASLSEDEILSSASENVSSSCWSLLESVVLLWWWW